MEDYQLPEGAEPWQTTCGAEVDLRYVQCGKVIVSSSTTVSGAAPLLLRPAPAVCVPPPSSCLCLAITLLISTCVAVISACSCFYDP